MAGYDQTYFLFNKFDWKPSNEKDALALQQTIVENSGDVKFPTIEIEFTMTNDRVKGFENWLNSINQVAFRPKKCTLKLSRGRFPVLGQDCTDLCGWYSEHLNIDPSPYPPPEAWEDKDIGDGLKPFERKDFYRIRVEGDEYFDPETGRTRPELKEYYDNICKTGAETTAE